MRAIIPVAGEGTRMRPHTLTNPKVLLPVGDKPIIAHIVQKLIDDGVDEIIFIVGYLGDLIEEYIKNTFKIVSHFVEQTEFLGLGHAIYTASNFLDKKPTLIVLGDTIYDADLKPIIVNQEHAIGVKKVESPERFGVAVLNRHGIITKLVEKPKEYVSNLALIGLYYFNNGQILKDALLKLITQNIKTKGEFQLTDALQLIIDQGEKIKTFNVNGWYDCGKPETLIETNGIILRRDFQQLKYKFENSTIIPPVYIHKNTIIRNSTIGPNVTVNESCEIDDSKISKSIICANSIIKSSILTQSIIGRFVKIQEQKGQFNLGDYSSINSDKLNIG
jgi:glucose-1-phosphate thymidylyltransferase